MIQSPTTALEPGEQAPGRLRLYEPDHAEASSDADLERIERARRLRTISCRVR